MPSTMPPSHAVMPPAGPVPPAAEPFLDMLEDDGSSGVPGQGRLARMAAHLDQV
jgi:hypothetical protein